MSATDEEIDAMAVAISRVSGHQKSWREWRDEAKAAWLVAEAKAESDLSTAREEMAALYRLVFRLELEPHSDPWSADLMEIRDRAVARHRAALRAGRTKGDPS